MFEREALCEESADFAQFALQVVQHCVWTPKGDHAPDQHSVILVDCASLGLGQYLSSRGILLCIGRGYWWIIT